MSGNKLFLDTNIIIYFLNGDETLINFLEDKEVYLSFISQIELLSLKGHVKKDREKIENFLSECIITDINALIKEEVIRIRQEYKLKLPDSIIAGTSLHHDLPLITADKAFNKVEELHLLRYNK